MKELFEKAFIGSMELRNRFVRSATYEGMAGENGEMTGPLIEIYRDLAKGGVGLILTGFAFVNKKGKANPGMLGADDDALIPGLTKLVDAVHQEGGKVSLQLAHGGSQCQFKTGMPYEAPSAVQERATGNMPVAMSGKDIQGLVQDFAEAALRGKKAGFDSVEIHSAHGYLLSQFLSPYSNRREDEYGGPIENRARVLFEVYEAVREKVGKDFPLTVKINSADYDGVGLSAEDSQWVCKHLSTMGMDAIQLSGGIPAAAKLSPARTHIVKPESEAYFRNHAKELSSQVDCPIILVGGLRSLDVIEEIYREGSAQFYSMSRPLISEPGLIKRWESGDRTKARCLSCNKCFGSTSEGHLYCLSFEGRK